MPLGENQKRFLQAIKRHGFWHRDCGWKFQDQYITEKLCASLEKRGLLVSRMEAGIRVWKLK
jgi:hypothetical protein